jgi:hypothetical protein
MGKKLRDYIRANLRMMARHKGYYLRNPAEREGRRTLLRALLALPVEAVEAIERNERPTAPALQMAANAARVPTSVVEEACSNFLFFFAPRGLLPRPSL